MLNHRLPRLTDARQCRFFFFFLLIGHTNIPTAFYRVANVPFQWNHKSAKNRFNYDERMELSLVKCHLKLKLLVTYYISSCWFWRNKQQLYNSFSDSSANLCSLELTFESSHTVVASVSQGLSTHHGRGVS